MPPITISGTTGIAGVDGSAGTPAMQGTDTNTGMFFPAADTIAFAEGGAEVMRFDSSGNVGIGTSSPSIGKVEAKDAAKAQLSVYGWSPTGATDVAGAIYLGNTSAYQGRVWYDGVTGSVGTLVLENTQGNAGAGIVFRTQSTERARIDGSGNLLVGTNSNFAGSGTNIVCSSNANCISANTTAASGTGWYLFSGYSNAPNVNSVGTLRFRVTDNGNVSNTNNSYGAISDAKLKENVTDATPKLEKLNQVRVVNFNIIGDTQKQIGVIAQELEQIFPGMVEETPDRDEEGNDLGTTTKSVKYSVFVPMLIKAVQEQQALIESLTARIAALEAA